MDRIFTHRIGVLLLGLWIGIYVSLPAAAQNPDWSWAKQAGGNREESGSVFTDKAGHAYAIGTYESPVQFGTQTFTVPPGMNSGIFFVKYDSAGTLLWAKSYPKEVSQLEFRSFDRQGNLYLYTRVSNTVTLGGVTITCSQYPDPCLIKYRADGTVIWIRRIGLGNLTLHASNILAMAPLDDARLAVSGLSTNDTIDGFPIEWDYWLAVMDSSGHFDRLKTLDGVGPYIGPLDMAGITPTGFAVKSDGTICLSGENYRNAELDLANWNLSFDTTAGHRQGFVARFTPDLDFLGSQTVKAQHHLGRAYANVRLPKIRFDDSDNAYMLYEIQADTLLLDATHVYTSMPAAQSHLLVKYAPDGHVLWDTLIGLPLSPPVAITRAYDVDGMGNVYYGGNFFGPLQFMGTTLQADGGSNLFVIKLNTHGAPQWIRYNRSTARGFLSNLAEDGRGNIFVAGRFTTPIAAPPTYTFGSVTLSVTPPLQANPYAADFYIAKLGNCRAVSPLISPNTPQHICNSGTVTLNASGATTYRWSTGDSTASITVSDSGSYFVYGADAAGCYNVSSSVRVDVASLNAGITRNGFVLTATPVNAGYVWGTCSGGNFSPVAGATAQTYTAASAGEYAVVVTQNGCSDTSDCFLLTLPGGWEENTLSDFSVYPNPSSGSFTVTLTDAPQTTRMSVTDLSGRTVWTQTFTGNSVQVQLPGLAKGLYQIQLHMDSRQTKSKKIILTD